MADGESGDPAGTSAESARGATPDEEAAANVAELRRRVEERYDFESFGPAEMDEMSREEWEAVFDPETWITGTELLDRVERDLGRRIAERDVFARLERVADPDRLVAYSDEGYAIVEPDGSVRGRGTVRRDVEPSVALCSMPDYELPDSPAEPSLPDPDDVPEGRGQFGHRMLMIVATAQVLGGGALFAAWVTGRVGLVALAAGLVFLLVGVVLFVVVANARISDRFRAAEYRNRLRAVGGDSGEPPAFLEAVRGESAEPSRWVDAGGEETAAAEDDPP